ncbi:LLM class flavin-dependent oxidoreductase [Lentzea sp. CA-135723]|uniref:LLM class flavin-dependent oxidoreductase n=1 Tax=Lentzea sp. CA-135723 TaxID=3239950 RepID=UPI003D93D241
MRPQLGCVLPDLTDPDEIRVFAEAAEDLGYDYLTVPEHLLSTSPSYESLTLTGFLSAVTTNLGLCAVTVLPLRSAALAAKQAAQVNLLSNGRLRLLAVAGWNTAETIASGTDPATRGRLMEHQIEAMRLLWTGTEVRYDSDHITLRGVRLSPPPPHPIPVWLGGGSARSLGRPPPHVLRRAAGLADGFTMSAVLGTGVSRGAELIADLLTEVDRAGRDRETFGVEARLATTTARANTWAATAKRWHDAGATHLTVSSRIAPTDVSAALALLTAAAEALA